MIKTWLISQYQKLHSHWRGRVSPDFLTSGDCQTFGPPIFRHRQSQGKAGIAFLKWYCHIETFAKKFWSLQVFGNVKAQSKILPSTVLSASSHSYYILWIMVNHETAGCITGFCQPERWSYINILIQPVVAGKLYVFITGFI
jgi:hypothetical protein